MPADVAALQLYAPVPEWRATAIQTLGQAARAGSADAVAQLTAYFQRDEYLTEHGLATARAIASAGTRPAYQVLIRALAASQSPVRRYAAMAALEEARPPAAAMLIAALNDRDAGVRSRSAELLGYRHDLVAATALRAATYDADPAVRAAAAWTLGGDLKVWSALGRLQELQAADPDEQVRAQAQLAEDGIRVSIARALGLAPESVLLVSVAPADSTIYAATADALYALQDSTHWRLAGPLPAYPTALAAGGTQQPVIYLGTQESGPFRSLDGGATWRRIAGGLPGAERLTVTALSINAPASPDARALTMSVSATFGTTEAHTTPLGVFNSSDGGETWRPAATGQRASSN